MVTTLLQDLRYGWRMLAKSHGLTAVVAITLALGIGANALIFSIVNGFLLRPLPVPHPERIAVLAATQKADLTLAYSFSYPEFTDFRKQAAPFAELFGYTLGLRGLSADNRADQILACFVTGNYFSALGATPALGRLIQSDEEDQPGRSHVVVLSHRLWQEHFGANPDIVGHNINLDGQGYLVAGVMPASFRFPDFAQVWTPMAWTDKERAVRGEHHYGVIARLKPGVELTQAQAEMNTISSRLEQLYPEDDKGWGAVVVRLHEDLVSDVRPALLVLLGAVTFVLLIACVNVANLTLAKTFSRQKEIAIRTALGASSARVLRQVLTETVLLALMGGAVGVGLGVASTAVYAETKGWEIVVPVLAWGGGFGAALLIGAVAGLLPALRAARMSPTEALWTV